MISMSDKVVKTRKTQIIKGRVSDKKYEEVQAYIEEKGLSVSSLVAVAVSEYMKNNKQEIIWGFYLWRIK